MVGLVVHEPDDSTAPRGFDEVREWAHDDDVGVEENRNSNGPSGVRKTVGAPSGAGIRVTWRATRSRCSEVRPASTRKIGSSWPTKS
jgi:hypothetical protein